MDKKLRLLIVEDSETSASATVRLFQKAGYEVEHKRVSTREDFSPELKKSKWDLIISDYTLPGFTALEVLRVLKETGLEIPFIVVSGTISEDTGVEAMKIGAHDYVMKDNLERLIVDAERELKDAGHRRKQKEAEKRYSVLFENAAEGIMGADIETRKLAFVNPAMCLLLGYTEEEIKGLSVPDIHPKEDLDRVLSEFEAQAKGEKTLAIDLPFLRKDGGIFYADVNTVSVELEGKRYNVAFVNDVTERKKAEDEVRHLNRVLRAIRGVNQLATTEKDPSRLIISVSKRLMETGGYGNVWIALFDENGVLKTFAGEKVEKDFPEVKKMLEKGKRFKCQEMALEKGGMIEIENPPKTCSGCPMSGGYGGRIAFCAPITREGKTYGTVTVSLPKDVASSKEEQGLFRELIGDLSYAFSAIETEEEGKKMQKKTEKHLRELEIFYESAIGREERILVLKKEVEELKKELGKKS